MHSFRKIVFFVEAISCLLLNQLNLFGLTQCRFDSDSAFAYVLDVVACS